MNHDHELSTHTISIAGVPYTIRTNEPVMVIQEAQQLIQKYIAQCTDQPLGHAHRLAYMTLNLATEYVKLKHRAEQLQLRDEHIMRLIDTVLNQHTRSINL